MEIKFNRPPEMTDAEFEYLYAEWVRNWGWEYEKYLDERKVA